MRKKDRHNIILATTILVMALFISYTLTARAGVIKVNESYVGTVVKVVDGDTLKVKIDGVVTNVRLAGIDTPETYNNNKAKKDIAVCHVDKSTMFSLGGRAKEKVASMYKPGDAVPMLVVDIGVYKRPIVWIGVISTNLVAGGYARVTDYKNLSPATMSMLYTLQSYAISKRLGIWQVLDCWKPKRIR